MAKSFKENELVFLWVQTPSIDQGVKMSVDIPLAAMYLQLPRDSSCALVRRGSFMDRYLDLGSTDTAFSVARATLL